MVSKLRILADLVKHLNGQQGSSVPLEAAALKQIAQIDPETGQTWPMSAATAEAVIQQVTPQAIIQSADAVTFEGKRAL